MTTWVPLFSYDSVFSIQHYPMVFAASHGCVSHETLQSVMNHDDMRYRLADGAQVRDEDFGLLFYTMDGPRLFFVPCGGLLNSSFFDGTWTLGRWMEREPSRFRDEGRRVQIEGALRSLAAKGVILEC